VASFDIEKQIENSIAGLDDYNKLLGRTLMQPFKPANSGSRALMSSIHSEHFLVPTHAEVATIQTGYENQFGENSSSYNTSSANYRVVYKIDKFSFKPNHHYYLIIQNIDTGVYDVIERVSYHHNTESYGYLWNNSVIDSLAEGDRISENDIIKTSTGFDEYGNKMNGVNLLTMYLSCAQNMEDSVILSETGAKKLETSLLKTTDIAINDNDVLLNKYGDNNVYKTFPDIGEEIVDGIFCSIRRIENDTVLYTLSQARLRESMISDRNILFEGIVADIDVACNNPEALADSYYNQQLYYYYKEKKRFAEEVNAKIGPIAMNGKMTYQLEKLYSVCRDIANGKRFYKNNDFNNVVMQVTIIEKLPMNPGDKLADRHGGKGVVSQILPDEMMPLLDNGKHVECIKNQSTCINRENIGQLHEQSLSFIGSRIIDYFRMHVCTYSEMCKIWYDFVSVVDKDLAIFELSGIDYYDENQAKMFIDMLFEDDRIILSTPAFTTPVNIDTIAEIYKKFPFIRPYKVVIPLTDSNGNVRYVETRRRLVAGQIYNYRLKQYAEEKFSVTSLAATNLKNLNTRSKANKMYEAKYTKTPIMFGAMECCDEVHVGMQYVVMNLMLYSSSPQARRLFEQLLIGDPYHIDIKLDKNSKNRNAEIINALLKTMGLELVFRKVPKVKKQMVKLVMCKTVPNKDHHYKTNIRDVMGHFDELESKYNIARQRPNDKPMVNLVMCKEVKKDDRS
jgi:DNA-directed RNA polymerase beta subunit